MHPTLAGLRWIDGDVAFVKLVATQWIDYMTILKQNGEWKIVSVLKRNQE